ncbi:hypothetical protein F5B17DRAFT_389871 [Nemania serpens]|nr:hypothetical protein F5B17DRAFT_389871 [Nemania serpens]
MSIATRLETSDPNCSRSNSLFSLLLCILHFRSGLGFTPHTRLPNIEAGTQQRWCIASDSARRDRSIDITRFLKQLCAQLSVPPLNLKLSQHDHRLYATHVNDKS